MSDRTVSSNSMKTWHNASMHAAFAAMDYVTLTVLYIILKFEAETQRQQKKLDKFVVKV